MVLKTSPMSGRGQSRAWASGRGRGLDPAPGLAPAVVLGRPRGSARRAGRPGPRQAGALGQSPVPCGGRRGPWGRFGAETLNFHSWLLSRVGEAGERRPAGHGVMFAWWGEGSGRWEQRFAPLLG